MSGVGRLESTLFELGETQMEIEPENQSEVDSRMSTRQKLTLGFSLGLAMLAVIGFSFSGIGSGTTKPATKTTTSTKTAAPVKSTRTVKYRLVSSNYVEATAAPRDRPKAGNITLQNQSGVTQIGTHYLPLRTKDGRDGLTGEYKPGSFLYISGQVEDYLTGKLTCEIYIDGVLVAQNTAQGSYSIVTCQATA